MATKTKLDRLKEALERKAPAPVVAEAPDLEGDVDDGRGGGEANQGGGEELNLDPDAALLADANETVLPRSLAPLPPPATEPAGLLPGEPVWYWEELGPGRLVLSPALLRERDRTGRWNVVVFASRRGPSLVVQRSAVRYAEKPAHQCWTTRNPAFVQEG